MCHTLKQMNPLGEVMESLDRKILGETNQKLEVSWKNLWSVQWYRINEEVDESVNDEIFLEIALPIKLQISEKLLFPEK